MEKDCSTCLYKEGLCYPSTTIFNKDKTCRSYTPDYEGYIAELEKENNELKTVKIPQLERKIASIRGTHSVDCKKLNARTEQVERLKKENAELKEQVKKVANTLAIHCQDTQKVIDEYEQENAGAKKIIGNLYAICKDNHYPNSSVLMEQAEQFLKEV